MPRTPMGRGGGRGGYRDDYQREELDKDNAYTSKNPLEENDDDVDSNDGDRPQTANTNRDHNNERD